MEKRSHRTLRLAAIISIAVAIGIVRIADSVQLVYAQQAPPDTESKLSVYQGVLFIMPVKVITSTNPANALEFGNAGRDIAGTDVINFRPGNTMRGTAFIGDIGHCSVDGLACGSDMDCTQPQTCVGKNYQNLKLTGDLTIGNQLCFNGYRDCFGTWPSMTSTLWELVGAESSALSPRQEPNTAYAYGIRVGDSSGGLSGKDAVVVTSSTTEPAVQVTKYSAFGDLNVQGRLTTPVSGNVFSFGSVYVRTTPKLYDPVNARTYDIWNVGSPTDTQDGSGIDADTFDSTALYLPFTKWQGMPYYDFFWRKYYTTNAAYPPVTVPSSTNEGILPMLCVRVYSTSGKVCVNGPSAGAACQGDDSCAVTQICGSRLYCSINTMRYCTEASQCPQTANPVPTDRPDQTKTKCQTLCHTEQQTCSVDNIWHCSNATSTVCLEDSDCPFGETCEQDQNPSGGNLKTFSKDCEQLNCNAECRGVTKCDGSGKINESGTIDCRDFGTTIRYNKGKCDTGTHQCLCSLNVRGMAALPFIDANVPQSGYVGGELCSGNFTTASIDHPPPYITP
ncbi:MAG: hypothetical protein V1907_01985 [Candidatus Kerfeldbacteria bacterium]